MKRRYVNLISSVGRLHFLFLDIVKIELEKIDVQDINNVQALLVFHIGEGSISIHELIYKAYHGSSNISYNIHKLSESGYLLQEKKANDKRSTIVKLTEKGLLLYKDLCIAFEDHAEKLTNYGFNQDLISQYNDLSSKLEDFWLYNISHHYR